MCSSDLNTDKLEDISLIYQYFEERINGEFITSEDSLNHFRSEERRVGKECRSRWWPDG
nr:hypothetical protein [Staphylococcus haemolyticus]